ncbi:MAG: hypothetical protein FJ098_00095, partial [Deltaproteobacteria bacterium]|nr:hypothetical protein [Deltaproteobacteria bacterium]
AVPAGLASPAVHPGVAAELDPWAEALAAAGDAGILALDLLRDARDGGADPAAVAALEAAAAALAARSARPTGPTMQDFLELALDWL